MRSFQDAYKMLDAAAATGIGLAMDIAAFRHMVLAIVTANSANCTIKVQGSLQTAMPNFAAASSPTNQWTYLQSIDLADQSVVNGATGIAATGTDLNRQLEVNVNGQRWVNVVITAYAAGNITVLGMPFNDNE
jgi:hypothetical protein